MPHTQNSDTLGSPNLLHFFFSIAAVRKQNPIARNLIANQVVGSSYSEFHAYDLAKIPHVSELFVFTELWIRNDEQVEILAINRFLGSSYPCAKPLNLTRCLPSKKRVLQIFRGKLPIEQTANNSENHLLESQLLRTGLNSPLFDLLLRISQGGQCVRKPVSAIEALAALPLVLRLVDSWSHRPQLGLHDG